jgi:hypothetical protein
MSKNSRRREWTRTDVREENTCSAEDASAKNCSDAQEDRGGNPTEGFQPGGFVGFANLEVLAAKRAQASRQELWGGACGRMAAQLLL